MSSPTLLLFGFDADRWARDHEIEPFTAPCPECGRELTTSIPMVRRGLRGMSAPRCECGNERVPYALILGGS